MILGLFVLGIICLLFCVIEYGIAWCFINSGDVMKVFVGNSILWMIPPTLVAGGGFMIFGLFLTPGAIR